MEHLDYVFDQKQTELDKHSNSSPSLRRIHVENGCTTVITLNYKTAIHYSNAPQPTSVHTLTIQDQSQPPATPAPRLAKRGEPLPGELSPAPLPVPLSWDGRAGQSPANPYPWKDVIAFSHATSYGNCPQSTTSTYSLPTGTPVALPPHDHPGAGFQDRGHAANFDLSLFVGGMVAGIIVAILALVSGCMLYRRRRKRMKESDQYGGGGHRLKEVDETLTCNSTQTATSYQTTMSEKRFMCQNGWKMEENRDSLTTNFAQNPQPVPIELQQTSPHSCTSESIETLIRSRSNSNPFCDRKFCNEARCPITTRGCSCGARTPLGSLSDSCSSNSAPSFLPGDDARFMTPAHQAFQGSTTTLTEISCAATIDSGSRSIQANDSFDSINSEELNQVRGHRSSSHFYPNTSSSKHTSSHLSSNIDSLINHKAFLLSMMLNQRMLAQTQQEQDESSPTNTEQSNSSTSSSSRPCILQPEPVIVSSEKISKNQENFDSSSPPRWRGSIDSKSSHESTYWIRRKKMTP